MLSRVEHAGERILIVRSGREVAALVPSEDLGLLEQLADDADIESARDEIESTKGEPAVPWSDLKKYFEVES
jgi:prevent-host-death family protein